MMSDTPQHRLQRASEAWSRIFNSAKPPRAKPLSASNNYKTMSKTNSTTPNINTDTPQILNQQPITMVSDNLRRNQSWGDSLTDKTHDYVIRIYAQNINGMRINKDGGQYKEICKIITEVKADIFCFQEHNLDTTQYEVKNILHETTNKQWQRARLTISSSPIQFSGTWKPGGTGSSQMVTSLEEY
jgi:hypothetical protein